MNVIDLNDSRLRDYILQRNDLTFCIIKGDIKEAAKLFSKQLPGTRTKKALHRIAVRFERRCNQSIRDAVAEEHQKKNDPVVVVSNFGF